MSPRQGDEISEMIFLALRRSDEVYRARMYVLRMLSYSDNTQKALYRKLLMRGISREIAAEAVREAVSSGYIREDRMLERLIIKEAEVSLTGPHKLRPKLISKGFSSDAVDEKIQELVLSGKIDFSASAERLKKKKLTRGATEDEIKKLLYKNGYDIC